LMIYAQLGYPQWIDAELEQRCDGAISSQEWSGRR
jgi:hypothetical protein